MIGHHSHCIQPFEIYKGKYIFYSLGNSIFPDNNVKAFYDQNNIPLRVFRKRQLKHNKISYAVCFDVAKKEVIAIDMLLFNRNILTKVKTIDLKPQTIKISPLKNFFIKNTRKYLCFLWSNFIVDGKLFDLNALRHEIKMKKGR